MEYINNISFDEFARQQITQQGSQATSPDNESITAVAAHSIDLTKSKKLAATRKSRTRNWPERSDSPEIIPSLVFYKSQHGDRITEIEPGSDSGRNLTAIFLDCDDEPRLKFNVRCKNGRSKQLWPLFRSVKEVDLPVGTTLKQVCNFFPLHVWGDGIRLFMAEGWTAEQIWNEIPLEARNSGAATRPWNYLQQAMGREADKMFEENGNLKRVPIKRKREDVLEHETDFQNQLLTPAASTRSFPYQPASTIDVCTPSSVYQHTRPVSTNYKLDFLVGLDTSTAVSPQPTPSLSSKKRQ